MIIKIFKMFIQIIALALYMIPTIIVWYKGVHIKYLLFLMICWTMGMTLFFLTMAIQPNKKPKEDEFDI